MRFFLGTSLWLISFPIGLIGALGLLLPKTLDIILKAILEQNRTAVSLVILAVWLIISLSSVELHHKEKEQ
jgi:hypothetical protein